MIPQVLALAGGRADAGAMEPCPNCGATSRLLYAGREGVWITVMGQWSAWFDGRSWERVTCPCGRLWYEHDTPLDPPENPRVRVSGPPLLPRAQ
jgi:hypothetical protein